MTLDQNTIDDSAPEQAAGFRIPSISRRKAAAAAFLTAMGPVGAALVSTPAAAQTAITDVDILNFALNLEYVEAEFYLRAISGQGLSASDTTGTGSAGGVNGGSIVPFVTPLFAQYAANIALDEQNHVRFLRSALGSAAVARPLIDLAGGFQGAAVAAGYRHERDAVQSVRRSGQLLPRRVHLRGRWRYGLRGRGSLDSEQGLPAWRQPRSSQWRPTMAA